MKKILILLLAAMMLTACGKTNTIYKEKKVPIYMVPAPPTIEMPDLPIHELDITWSSPVDRIGEIAQAYVISVRLLMNWGQANRDIVEAYRDMSERDFSIEPVTFAMAGPNADKSDVAGLETDKESDYGTIQRFANAKFREIEDKYREDNELIMQSYNETITTEEP